MKRCRLCGSAMEKQSWADVCPHCDRRCTRSRVGRPCELCKNAEKR